MNGQRRNGKGKEYNTYGYFEGEYLNGQKYGKCKEYVYSKLIYKDSYSNGIGKVYNTIELIFEGEFLKKERDE